MSNSTPYLIGRLVAKHPVAVAIVVIGAVGLVLFTPSSPEPKQAPSVTTISANAQAQQAAKAECEAERPAMLEQYAAKLQAGQNWGAATELRRCATRLQDAEMLAMVASAEILHYQVTVKNPKVATHARQQALDNLRASGAPATPELARLEKTLATLADKERKASEKAAAARKRSEGAAIGMTTEDVLASAWGKPNNINRSIYSHGVREQWVYGGGNYLYFRDGVLDSIQTGN
jgi:hypothetical protein